MKQYNYRESQRSLGCGDSHDKHGENMTIHAFVQS
jgi:hypothetical protein